ncbi:MAG: glycosyltransferase [Acidobacteria bacterium]|nr:glycosyltransferase [Acidobacteriota bacterium]
MRAGDRVTVLAPHTEGLAAGWDDGGVTVRTFRYAPERFEVMGYSRSLDRDESARLGALAVAPAYAFAARRAVRQALRAEPFDLVHAHWVVPNGVVLGRFRAPGGRRVPLAVGLHGSDVFMAEKRALAWPVRRTLSATAVLTGCSPELVDRVCALGFPSERSRVIPYGVDVEHFSPDPSRRGLWRDQLGIPLAAPVAVSVGRMATKKGYQVLIPELGALFEASPDLHLVLAGGGDRLEEFRRAAAPWADRVHFPGAVYRDTLPDLYRSADVFVLPAVHDRAGNVDGLPNVILEAMASGLPVVASAISGIPLAVEEGVTGRLVPEGDGPAVRHALVELAEDRELARRLGAAGRARARRDLTWDVVAKRYRSAYDLALGENTDE